MVLSGTYLKVVDLGLIQNFAANLEKNLFRIYLTHLLRTFPHQISNHFEGG